MPFERGRGPLVVEAGLCLFAASLPLSIAGANIGWAVAAAGLILCWKEGVAVRWDAWRSPLFAPLAAYVAVAAVSGAFGSEPAEALKLLQKDAHKLWVLFILTTAFSACKPQRPFYSLLAGGAAAATMSIPQWFAGLSAIGPTARAAAFLHPVTFGEQVSVIFLAALALSADLSGQGRSRAASWALTLLFGGTLLLSNTRGAQAAALAGVLLGTSVVPNLRKKAVGLCLVAVAGAVAVDLMRPQRSLLLILIGSAQHSPLQPAQGQLARFTLWDAAVRMGADHPVTGAGLGGYRTLLPSYIPPGTLFDGNEKSWGNAHNLYLHHFAERGILGLCALAWLLWRYASTAVRRTRERPGVLTLWSLAAAAAFLVMNLTEVAFQVELVWMMALFAWCAAEAET